jgi:hypothetical protein
VFGLSMIVFIFLWLSANSKIQVLTEKTLSTSMPTS